MKRILLPTDFSKNAWNAISYAAQLFKNETCTFYLLHTYTPIIYHTEFVMLNPNDIEISNIVRETAEKDMEETRKKLVETYPNDKHEVETIVSFNTLISEIKDQMEKLKIDYIVMGTKGATGATEILFGTNTVHVLNHIKCPLIAVSEKYKVESPENILFPSDYYINFEEKHIQPIIDVVKPNNGILNILHVSHGYELSYKNLQNKNKLETLLGDTNFKFHDVSDDSLEDAINKFIKEQHVDLLVLINNKKSFFENLFFRPFVNKMGLHLEIPLMVIPSYAK
jgi:nucleotide-binding universal stress UspA family protein